jgi:branched-chain amino acid transport system permease protein
MASLRGRPELFTSYEQDIALLNTPGKRVGVGLLLVVALAIPFVVTDDWLQLLGVGFAVAIGAIGLNLVTGYAGQVSLGHAFFLGIGTYAAAIVGGVAGRGVIGYGFDMPIWLLAAGVAAAITGAIVAPLALRLRGLYLAIVTLGLVFLGDHIFKEAGAITGGVGVGRSTAVPIVMGYRFDVPGNLLGIMMTKQQKLYFLTLLFLVLFALIGRNLARSAVGRAFAAVRDRDIAAEVIGVSLTKTKLLAFTVSSFFAGVAGALVYSHLGYVEPTTFGLLLSVQYIAMILIGGAATIAGSIMGALFITLLNRITQELSRAVPAVSDVLTLGGLLSIFDLQAVLYGLLIIVFLIFEPRGLFGIWIRARNYWKGWPFSY